VVFGKLQNQLDSLSDYFKDWEIRINLTKTQAIFFTRRFSPRMLPASNLKLNNQEIHWSSEVKYLGLNLDKRLTFALHTAKAIYKAEKAFTTNKCIHWRYSTDTLQEETNMLRNEDFGLKIHDKFMHRSRFSENSLILGLF
jgi:hypothetical protein